MRKLLLILLIQAAPAQSEAEKLEAALKKFGDRTYGMYVSGRKSGLLKMKTKVETVDGRRLAIFEDSIIEPAVGGTETGKVTEKSSLEGLRLSSVRRVSVMSGSRIIDTFTIEGSKAVLRSAGEQKILDVPASTMGDLGVLRRVCAEEQKKGATFTVEVLSHAAQELQTRDLRCDGDVDVEIAGKKQPAMRWSERGREGQPGANVKNMYWVSAAGYLLKYVGPGGVEYLLESK